jgi:hypothetical protein
MEGKTCFDFLYNFSSKHFEKSSNINHHEYPPNRSRVVPCGQTDRHEEADSRFSQLCEHALETKNNQRFSSATSLCVCVCVYIGIYIYIYIYICIAVLHSQSPPSICMTTFSADLTNLTAPPLQSRECSYHVSRTILALPPS